MKHKVSELSGELLDAAVAKAEGLPKPGSMVKHWIPGLANGWIDASFYQPGPFAYSADWKHGGPIKTREKIVAWPVERPFEPADPNAYDEFRVGWNALHPDSKGLGGYFNHGTIDVSERDGMFGETELIACMRALVQAKFGDEVDLP